MQSRYRNRAASLIWCTASTFVLIACAGGGGSGSSSTVPVQTIPGTPTATPTVDPNSFRTADYLRIGVLDAVHAADAYALGYTGKGVTIGIVDFNFALASNQVSFASGSIGPNPQMVTLYNAQTGSTSSTDQHGQAVAVTAAGVGNGTGFQGLAFQSKVLAVDYFSDVNEQRVTQSGVLYHVSDPWTYITSRGVRIYQYVLWLRGRRHHSRLPGPACRRGLCPGFAGNGGAKRCATRFVSWERGQRQSVPGQSRYDFRSSGRVAS